MASQLIRARSEASHASLRDPADSGACRLREEAGQHAERGQQVRAADDVRDGFGREGMNGPQRGGPKATAENAESAEKGFLCELCELRGCISGSPGRCCFAFLRQDRRGERDPFCLLDAVRLGDALDFRNGDRFVLQEGFHLHVYACASASANVMTGRRPVSTFRQRIAVDARMTTAHTSMIVVQIEFT